MRPYNGVLRFLLLQNGREEHTTAFWGNGILQLIATIENRKESWSTQRERNALEF
jgi:hypothetical protein